MTSATLSVSIKTEAARKGLLDLKQWMKSEMKGLALDINEATLQSSVQRALTAKKYTIAIDTDTLKTQASAALTSVFNHTFKINVDTAHLTGQVKTAVQSGMAGAAVASSGAAGAASGGMLVNVVETIQKTLLPAVDSLTNAATLLRSAGVPGGAGIGPVVAAAGGPGKRQGKVSFSATGDLGERLSYSYAATDPEALKTQILSRMSLAEMQKSSNETFRVRQRLLKEESRQEQERLRMWLARRDQEERAAEALRQSSNVTAEYLRLGKETRAQYLQNERTRLDGWYRRKAEEDAHNASLRASNNVTSDYLRMGREARKQSDASERLRLDGWYRRKANEDLEFEAQRKANNVTAQYLQMGAQARAEAAAARARINSAKENNNKLELAQVRKEEREALAAEKVRLGQIYERAKFGAAGTYNATGQRIAGAGALVGAVGEDRARSFLGRSGFLVDEVRNLDDYKVKLREVAQAKDNVVEKANKAATAHREVRRAMWDAHSAARGLAGSLGLLWVTWGSTVPIAAAAAIGATLRTVYQVGKDLEYQLTFVAQLTGETTISVEKFGAAVRGSLVPPVEAAQALRGLAQNGLSAREALSALPTILQLATAGEMSLAEAALGATGVMAAFNMRASDLGRVSDVFAKAAALSNTSVAAMVESMKQASTVSDQYHVSLEQTAASLATMAKRNITGTAAGTAFRNMMVELASPTDAAKRAMAALGLQVFDTQGKLKPFEEILRQLKDRTDALNEQSKLAFFKEIFNERGAKAANALMSDFETFQKLLREIKEDSKDFTRSLTDALQQTTQGKFRALISEFQLSAAQAFSTAKTSADLFMDSLRNAVASPEFQNGIGVLARNLASISTTLIENARTIGLAVSAWMSYRVAVGAAIWATESLNVVLKMTTVASTALRWSLTAVFAVLLPLTVYWALFRDRVDEATERQRAFNESVTAHLRGLEESIKRLKDENEFLDRRNELMRQGYSLEQANKKAGAPDQVTAKNKIQQTLNDLANAKKIYEDAQAKLDPENPSALGYMAVERARRGYELALDNYNKAVASLKGAQEQQAEEERKRDNERYADQMRRAREFNDQYTAFMEYQRRNNKKVSLEPMFFTPTEMQLPSNSFGALLADRQEKLNAARTNLKVPNAETLRMERALSDQVIAALRAEEDQVKTNIKHREELDKARYGRFGNEVSALLAETRERQGTIELIRLEENMMERLKIARAGMSDPADRIRMDTEIAQREVNIKKMQLELEHRTEIAKIRAATKNFEDERAFQTQMGQLGVGLEKQLNDINTKYRLKIMDPVEAEGIRAELAAVERYMSAIDRQSEKIVTAQERLRAVEEELEWATAAEYEEKKALVDATQQVLSKEEARLLLLRQQAQEARAIAGAAARREATYAQTAGYGWDRFWAEYVTNATTASKLVYDAMSSTTKKMEEAFANFVITGKLNFKSLVASITADLARMMATKAMQQFIMMAFNFAMSGSGGNDSLYQSAYGPSTDMSENGNIMTSMGPLPLQRFSKGGVAYSPRVAIFGEGRRPEAYVPLPDGRTIPVTMQGGGGGGVHVETNVYVTADGSTRSETQTSGADAAKLGKMIELAVTSEIVKQQRPGGVLYNTARA